MRFIDKDGNTLDLAACMNAESFYIESADYVQEPREMHFDANGELRAGKKSKRTAIAS